MLFIWGCFMEFSTKVKYVRQKLFLTQKELADKCGVSLLTVSRWEREDRKPRLASVGKFIAYCESQGISFENDKENDE